MTRRVSDIAEAIGTISREQLLAAADRNTCGLVPHGVPTLTLDGGEANKDIRSVEKIWDFLHAHNATREATLLCVGGGTAVEETERDSATGVRKVMRDGVIYLLMPDGRIYDLQGAEVK